MYQVEGKYPSRRSHTALEFYRLEKPHIYSSGGLLPTYLNTQCFNDFNLKMFSPTNRNGPEWHRLRQSLQRPINMTENIRHYVSDIDNIACEFTDYVHNLTTSKKSSTDFLEDLSKVFLECTLLITDN